MKHRPQSKFQIITKKISLLIYYILEIQIYLNRL